MKRNYWSKQMPNKQISVEVVSWRTFSITEVQLFDEDFLRKKEINKT